jgi:hypothetical protein
VRPKQIERAAHAAHHADAKHVDLHELELLDILLFPFDDTAIDHGGGLDRDEIGKMVAGEHEAARMLAEVARRADQLPGKIERQGQARIGRVQVEIGGMAFLHAFLRPAPDLAGQCAGHVFRQPQCLADLAHRAAGTKAADHGSEGGMLVAVGLIDPLNDDFPPFMLEIDINVGRLVPRARDEPLEQQSMPDRVDRGDAERVADQRIGGRSTPLAQDALAPGEADDRVHGQEVRRIAHLMHQPQFVLQQPFVAARRC